VLHLRSSADFIIRISSTTLSPLSSLKIITGGVKSAAFQTASVKKV